MLYATRRINLRHLEKEEKVLLKKLCVLSKKIYNQALDNIENHFKDTGQFLFWKDNYKLIKSFWAYKELGSRYQAILKEAESNYKTFMTTIKNGKQYNLYKDWQKANPPKKKKHYFPLISENFSQNNGMVKIPMSIKYRKSYKDIWIALPHDLKETKIKKIVVRPKFYTMEEFELLVIYKVDEISLNLDKNNALAIDLGVSNFATCADTNGKCFIIDGKKIKSINQGFNKTVAKINRMKKKQGNKGYTKGYRKLINKRTNQVQDYLNKSVAFIVNYCIKNEIANIAIGYNQAFQELSNIGHRNNQIFTQMPYSKFLKKLKFKCKKNNINLTIVDESYTSKASFLDNDFLPEKRSNKKYTFSGKRVKRGLYIASDGRLINADVNGAFNILRKRKLVSPAIIRRIQSSGVAQPTRIRQ
ncbi:RNA-guided endonuclease InsQ/TnpB family protein [Dethiothermospora halolimnae]|uniref:RNA-guided endonuclease InsQ/TnpB family protein n=1 Tax=Dethiothermospora halolimnae TaxID=3114390 RepID=UPI003CCBCABF